MRKIQTAWARPELSRLRWIRLEGYSGPRSQSDAMQLQSAGAAAKPAFDPDIEPFHAFLKESVDRIKTVDPLPDDPKRRAELKERIARGEADKEARRQRTKQDAAIREILPNLATGWRRRERKPCNKAAAP